VFKGATRELERANGFPPGLPGQGHWLKSIVLALKGKLLPLSEPLRRNTKQESRMGIVSPATSEVIRDEPLAVVAEHSTEGCRNIAIGKVGK
jgi:hypothetical protein